MLLFNTSLKKWLSMQSFTHQKVKSTITIIFLSHIHHNQQLRVSSQGPGPVFEPPPRPCCYIWYGCCDFSHPVLNRLWKCFSSGFKCSSHRESTLTWRSWACWDGVHSWLWHISFTNYWIFGRIQHLKIRMVFFLHALSILLIVKLDLSSIY